MSNPIRLRRVSFGFMLVTMARTKKALDPIDSRVQELLSEAVARTDLTQGQIGKQIGLSQNRVSIILRRDTPPASIGELHAIAKLVGVRVSDLIEQAETELSERSNRFEFPSQPPEFELAASDHTFEDEQPGSDEPA